MRSILLLFLLVLHAACSDSDADPSQSGVLRFSAIPDENTQRLRENFDPVAEALSAALGMEVEYVPATSYAASVQMFKNGEIQMAWFGGLTSVQARQAVEGAHAIAQGLEDPQYQSYFIAHKDSGLEPSREFPAGIAALKFTFGSESSTSGRLMPQFFIEQMSGKKIDDFFAEQYGFQKGHDMTAKAVENGSYQAGALSYKKYDTMVAAGELDPATCRIIWKTPPYPDYNITAHPDLEKMEAGLTKRLQKALIALDPALVKSAFMRSRLIAAQDSDFDRIVTVARGLGMAR